MAAILTTDDRSISIALQYDESSIGSPKTSREKSCNYTSNLTTVPGIAIVILQKIELQFRFQDRSAVIDAYSNGDDADIIPCSSDAGSSTSFTDITTLSESAIHSQDDNELSKQGRPFSSRSRTSSFSSLDHDFRVELNGYKDSLDAATSCQTSIGNISVTEEIPYQPTPDLTLALKMIESAIRVDLLGGRESTKFASSDSYITTTLPELCPMMFSPGYLKV